MHHAIGIVGPIERPGWPGGTTAQTQYLKQVNAATRDEMHKTQLEVEHAMQAAMGIVILHVTVAR